MIRTITQWMPMRPAGAVLAKIVEGVSCLLGTDRALLNKLHELPFFPYNDVNRESVLYGRDVLIEVWQAASRQPVESNDLLVPTDRRLHEALQNLVVQKLSPEAVNLPVAFLHGFGALRGIIGCRHVQYRNLREFARALYRPYEPQYCYPGDFYTIRDLHYNAARLLSKSVHGFDIHYREWDDKFFYMREDGVYYLAALYRQCQCLGLTFSLPARVTTASIDPQNAASIFNRYDILLMAFSTYSNLRDTLRAFEIEHQKFLYDHENALILLFLPKHQARTQLLSQALLAIAPANALFDFGRHLRRQVGQAWVRSCASFRPQRSVKSHRRR